MALETGRLVIMGFKWQCDFQGQELRSSTLL